jgi:hypothetical protein
MGFSSGRRASSRVEGFGQAHEHPRAVTQQGCGGGDAILTDTGLPERTSVV